MALGTHWWRVLLSELLCSLVCALKWAVTETTSVLGLNPIYHRNGGKAQRERAQSVNSDKSFENCRVLFAHASPPLSGTQDISGDSFTQILVPGLLTACLEWCFPSSCAQVQAVPIRINENLLWPIER